ncbi:MAG: glycosyltransferase family 4 protein [Microthrixaceae bacterium]|nr:glycosyltransferase family 4 protein [Microthrixaceae bacterium]
MSTAEHPERTGSGAALPERHVPKVHVEVTTTLAARFTAGYERMVRCLIEEVQRIPDAPIELVPVVAAHRDQHRRLTDDERARLAEHPAGGTNRRRADRFGPLSPAVRRAVAIPAVGRARNALARQRRRLTTSPAIRGLDIGMPEYGSVWLDLEPAWNDPADRAELLTRLAAEGVHSAAMVADVMPEKHPEWFDPNQRRLFGRWLDAHLEHSELFLTISRNTENDLREVAEARGHDPELNCVVVPLGAELPAAQPSPVELPRGMDRFLLVVGTLEPRKNQALVIDAFDQLSARHPDLGLVLVGRQGWMVEDLVSRIRDHPLAGTRLLWPDGVTDAELAWLYGNAFLTIAPSHYEGLGVPVMEALGHGSPTLASDGGAQGEAGGTHVETIDPDDLDTLCVVLERHLLDPAHHQALVDRAATYSAPRWSTGAEVMAAALAELAAHRPPGAGRHPHLPGPGRPDPGSPEPGPPEPGPPEPGPPDPAQDDRPENDRPRDNSPHD